MDWSRILRGAGDVVQHASYVVIMNRWLQQDDEAAYGQVAQYVTSSSPGEIDRMDAALLNTAATHLDPRARVRLIRFYTAFKLNETARFGTFRGFP